MADGQTWNWERELEGFDGMTVVVTGPALAADGGYTAGRAHGLTEMMGLQGP